MKKIFNSQKGLSFIEIMVSVSIISVVFISLMYSFPLGLSMGKSAESATIASYLAQQKMEEIHSLGYANTNVGTIESKSRISTDPSSYLYNYQRETVVDYLNENFQVTASDLGLKRISVTIYFYDAISRKEKSYNTTTAISRL